MKPTRLLCVLALLPLAACSGIRPYDGVVGYEVGEKTATAAQLTYTAEAGKTWETLEGKALRACAQELNLPASGLQSQVTAKEELSRTIRFPMPVPVGMTSDGTPSSSSAGTGLVQQSVSMDESVSRDLKLKKLTLDCAAR